MLPRSPRLLTAAIATTATLVVLVGHATAVTASDSGYRSPARPPTGHALAATRPVSATPVTRVARTRNVTVARPTRAPRAHRALLPSRTQGIEALRRLGSRLPAVARRNGMSAQHLGRVLRTDRTAYLSSEGDLFFVERGLAAQTTAQTIPAPAYPTSQTFRLHSKPGASRTIFLDVDGATVRGTGWNTSHRGKLPDGTYTGLDLDGDPTTFSTAEHGYVQEIWREVSETYAPFDVDVTTQDPGTAGSLRSSTADTTYGTRVVITSDPRPRAALCGGCLGVAWMGTFGAVDRTGYYQPAWVFAYSRSFDPMVIAQASSHETGHTLGLSHDGTGDGIGANNYYAGTSAWGPIMGSSMPRAVSQFSAGEYAGADNSEDDLAVIQHTGLPLRPDDHPSSVATAEQLGQHASYAVSGIIGTRTDTDVFAVDLPCTTTLSAQANGIGAQTTLDLSLTVLDAHGTPVTSDAPTSGWLGNPPVSTGMNAAVTVPAASGTYYLVVDGTGSGDPRNGGWSDYDSLGQYRLSASGCADTSPTPSASASPTATQAAVPSVSPTPSATTPTRHAPSAPRIALPLSGHPGGLHTVVARWYSPASTGGSPLVRYRVLALHYDYRGHYRGSYLYTYLRPTAHYVAFRLPLGHYRFRVQAINAYGGSAWSSYSRMASSR